MLGTDIQLMILTQLGTVAVPEISKDLLYDDGEVRGENIFGFTDTHIPNFFWGKSALAT